MAYKRVYENCMYLRAWRARLTLEHSRDQSIILETQPREMADERKAARFGNKTHTSRFSYRVILNFHFPNFILLPCARRTVRR